jgi:hypothetical protein
MASFTDRLVGAAKLDAATYEEVEADTTAMGQALGVVLLAAGAAGIGAIRGGSPGALVATVVLSLIGWVVWALMTFVIGTKVLPEPQTNADLNQLLRTTAFAQAPGILRVAGIIPFLGALVNFLIAIWMLVAMVVAVRQALDYTSTMRAVGVCLIGWVVYLVIVMILTPFMVLGSMATS